MTNRNLAAFVHVGNRVYGPGDDVPADVAKQITNPKAWAESKDETPAKKTAPKPPKPSEK